MIMAGSFQAFSGLVAVFEDEFYVATREYVLQFDATTWGWIHLLLGANGGVRGMRGARRQDLGPGDRHHAG